MPINLAQFTGGAVNHAYGILNPVGFGKTTKLILTEDRLIEITQKFIASRYCEIRVARIDSVEITEQGISWLLALGFITIAFYGLGLIFIVLYFFLKNKYLVIYSGNNVIATQIRKKSDASIASDFIKKLLDQADAFSQVKN